MYPVPDGHSVVIRGAWNRLIFNPVWVDQELAGGSGVQAQIALGDHSMPLRLQFGGVLLRVASDRLILGVAEAVTSMGAVQEAATQLLKTLNHTPVSAVGVNFQFREDEPSQELREVFAATDLDKFASAESVVRSRALRREVELGEHVINVSLLLGEDGPVTIDLNFHRAVTTSAEALAYLELGVDNCRAIADRIVHDVYDSSHQGVANG